MTVNDVTVDATRAHETDFGIPVMSAIALNTARNEVLLIGVANTPNSTTMHTSFYCRDCDVGIHVFS